MRVQTYTVDYHRNGNPVRGHIVGRLKSNGERFLANHADEQTLRELSSWDEEQVGKSGRVKSDGQGRNLFSFAEAAKL